MSSPNTTPDLRALDETMGKRLYNLAYHIGDPVFVPPLRPEWELAGPITREYWRRLGRECIRQMEWARRVATGTELTYIVSGGLRCSFPDLTAAPDDWTPSS